MLSNQQQINKSFNLILTVIIIALYYSKPNLLLINWLESVPVYSNSILTKQESMRVCPLSHTADSASTYEERERTKFRAELQLDNGNSTIKSMTDGRSVYQVQKWGQANKRNRLPS